MPLPDFITQGCEGIAPFNIPAAATEPNPMHGIDDFRGELQALPSWCFAAAATTIQNFYRPDKAAQRPQCWFVARAATWPPEVDQGPCSCGCDTEFGQDCAAADRQCGNPVWNGPGELPRALRLPEIDMLDAMPDEAGGEPFPDTVDQQLRLYGWIRAAIRARRPVAVLVLDEEHGAVVGHFIVIYGFDDGGLFYWDPLSGQCYRSLEDIQAFLGGVQVTMFTRPPAGGAG